MFECFVCLQAIVELQSEKYVHVVDEETALQLEQNDRSLFVFSDFTSDAFDHCRQVRVQCQHSNVCTGPTTLHYENIFLDGVTAMCVPSIPRFVHSRS